MDAMHACRPRSRKMIDPTTIAVLLLLATPTVSFPQSTFWSKVAGLPEGEITSLICHPNGQLFVGVQDYGVYSSSDDGSTWAQFGRVFSYHPEAFGVDSSGMLYSCSDAGLLRSRADSADWTKVYPPNSYEYTGVLSVLPTRDGYLLIGAAEYTSPPKRSTDNGRTWQTMNPAGAPLWGIVALAEADDRTIFVGEVGNGPSDGVFRSRDAGLNWQRVSDPKQFLAVPCLLLRGGGEVLAGTHYQVFRSTDSGDSWSTSGDTFANGLVTALLEPKRGSIYAGTGEGVFVSSPGETWSSVGQSTLRQKITALAVDHYGHLFAGTSSGLYRSISSVTEIEDLPSTAETHEIPPKSYPNPFNGTVTITFSIPSPTLVRVSIFSTLGQEVAVLANQELSAGEHSMVFDARNLPSAVYFCRVASGATTRTIKLLMIR